MTSQSWSRDELLVAFNLYCRIPFGRIHQTNPEINSLAQSIGRTPDALAMKLTNFASLDPAYKAGNAKDPANNDKADRQIWEEFHNDWEELAIESHNALERFVESLTLYDPDEEPGSLAVSSRPDVSETIGMTRIRLVQEFFRDAVHSSYDYRCAICALDIPELLIASHIVPWNIDIKKRADPTNGLSLCAIHDKAFDRGLIGVDENYRIMLSNRLSNSSESRLFEAAFTSINGEKLNMPSRFPPNPDSLAYHRENIFVM